MLKALFECFSSAFLRRKIKLQKNFLIKKWLCCSSEEIWVDYFEKLANFKEVVITVGKAITCNYNNISTGMINVSVIGPIGISWSEALWICQFCSIVSSKVTPSYCSYYLNGKKKVKIKMKGFKIRLCSDSRQSVLVQNHFPICW